MKDTVTSTAMYIVVILYLTSRIRHFPNSLVFLAMDLRDSIVVSFANVNKLLNKEERVSLCLYMIVRFVNCVVERLGNVLECNPKLLNLYVVLLLKFSL